MADTLTQTQTTATPATASSPEGSRSSATPAPTTTTKTESGRSLNASIEAAFAAAESATGTDSPQAPRGRTPTPATAADTDTEDDVTTTDDSEDEDATAEDTSSTDASEDTTAEDTATEAEETAAEEQLNLDDVDELTAEAMKNIKGADKVPKGFVKRLVKQSAQIRDLKSQLTAAAPIIITPTPASPLADVDTVDDLQARIQAARETKKWALANPDGATVKRGGKEIDLSAEDVQTRLERAEAEIEAYADRKIALAERAQSKPWETAATIAPDMFKPGTGDHTVVTHLLKVCPELKTKFTDYETVLAYLAKGYRIATEEAGGKAKYVRVELKDGKPVTSATDKTQALVKPKPKAPASPQGTRPELQTGAGQKRSKAENIAALPAHLRNDPEARLRASIEAAEAA